MSVCRTDALDRLATGARKLVCRGRFETPTERSLKPLPLPLGYRHVLLQSHRLRKHLGRHPGRAAKAARPGTQVPRHHEVGMAGVHGSRLSRLKPAPDLIRGRSAGMTTEEIVRRHIR